jgi:hypothetical protein
MQLPSVRGSNLLRQTVQLPADLGGDLNLLFVAFQQWQQMEVDSWGALMSQLELDRPGFRYYELPTIERRNVLWQTFINESMRAGIPDPATRRRTITLYIDKKAFRGAAGLPDEDHIYLLLTDRSGNILWRSRGEYTVVKAAGLEIAIDEFNLQAQFA